VSESNLCVKLDYDYGSQSVEESAIGNWKAIISKKSGNQGATKNVRMSDNKINRENRI
jgi:hypothetical protein